MEHADRTWQPDSSCHWSTTRVQQATVCQSRLAQRPDDAWKDAPERLAALDDFDDLCDRDPGPEGPEPRPDLGFAVGTADR